jgi:hypothetical protein
MQTLKLTASCKLWQSTTLGVGKRDGGIAINWNMGTQEEEKGCSASTVTLHNSTYSGAAFQVSGDRNSDPKHAQSGSELHHHTGPIGSHLCNYTKYRSTGNIQNTTALPSAAETCVDMEREPTPPPPSSALTWTALPANRLCLRMYSLCLIHFFALISTSLPRLALFVPAYERLVATPMLDRMCSVRTAPPPLALARIFELGAAEHESDNSEGME